MRQWIYNNHPFWFLTKLIFYWPFQAMWYGCVMIPYYIYLGFWYSLVYLLTFGWIADIYKITKGTATNKEKVYVGLALAFIAVGIWTRLVNG